MTPRVTVLMSVYNGERYLAESIDSLLAQTYGDFELLVINDASTDRSRNLLASYSDPRIRIIDNGSNLGLTASLNIGLAAARGELVARQDADDSSHPRRLEKQVGFLDSHPHIAVLGTGVRFVDERGRPIRARSSMWPRCETLQAIRWQLMFESPFTHSSVMFRRAVIWGEFKGYDESFRTSQDYELWSRVARIHAMTNLPEPLVDFRNHSTSISTKYTEPNVDKVRDVLRRNMVETLGDGDYENWLDFWITVNSPRTYGEIRALDGFVKRLREIRNRFDERHPGAAGNREIDRQIGGALARVSCTIARYHPLSALAAYGAALRAAHLAALSVLPRLLANLVLHRPLRVVHAPDEN